MSFIVVVVAISCLIVNSNSIETGFLFSWKKMYISQHIVVVVISLFIVYYHYGLGLIVVFAYLQ